MSGTGPNNPNFEHSGAEARGSGFGVRERVVEVAQTSAVEVCGLSDHRTRAARTPEAVQALRPRVQELIEQVASDPGARALVGTYLLQADGGGAEAAKRPGPPASKPKEKRRSKGTMMAPSPFSGESGWLVLIMSWPAARLRFQP